MTPRDAKPLIEFESSNGDRDRVLSKIIDEIADIAEKLSKKKVDDLESILIDDEEIDLINHTKLPPRDKNFTARETELETIIPILQQKENNFYEIVGMGGVGKTALATEISHRLVNYFADGILWIKFERDLNEEDIYHDIITQLNISKITYDFEKRINEKLKEKNILIVFDNVEDHNTELFKQIYKIFTKFPRLITTRERVIVEDGKKIDLKVFELNDSKPLFKRFYKKENFSESDIEELCNEVGNLAIAIKILALKSQNESIEFSDLMSELKKSKEILKIELLKSDGIEYLNAFASFDVTYQNLTNTEKAVFEACGIFKYPFDLEALKKVSGINESRNEIRKSTRFSLINEDEKNKRFSLHPLIRDFAEKKLLKSNKYESVFENRVKYYLNIARNHQKDKLYEETNEVIEVIREFKEKNRQNEYFNFLNIMINWLFEEGFWSKDIEVLDEAIKYCENKNLRKEKIILLDKKADILHLQGKYEEAKVNFKECLFFYEKEKDIDIQKIFWINYSLNSIQYDSRNYSKAYFDNVKFVRKTFYFKNRHFNSFFHRTSSWIASLSNHFIFLQKNIITDIKDKSKDDDKSNFIRGIYDLINIKIKKGKYQSALKLVEKLNDLDINVNKFDKIIILQYSIQLKVILKDYMQAKEYLKNFLKEIKEFDSKEFENKKIEFLALIEFFENRIDKAIENFEKLEDKEVKKYWLGRCYLKTKEFDKAKESLEKAVNHEIDIGDTLNEAKKSIFLAEAELHSENIKESIKLITLSENTLLKYEVEDLEDLKEVKNKITQKIGNEKFNELAKEYKNEVFTTDKDEFLLNNINPMVSEREVFIPKSSFFFGKGETRSLSIDEIFENIEKALDGSLFNGLADEYVLYPMIVDKYLVTNREYYEFCTQTGYKKPWKSGKYEEGKENYPVTNISANDAKEYAKFIKKELLLEEEWERIARGESGNIYVWGNEWNSGFLQKGDKSGYEVGSNPLDKTKEGVYDLMGNVREITINHEGAKLKGNSCIVTDPKEFKLTNSKDVKNNFKAENVGFRCVKPIFSLDDLKVTLNLTKVEIDNFRVLEDVKIEFKVPNGENSINLLVGINGSGKTSILELIYKASISSNDLDSKFKLYFNGNEILNDENFNRDNSNFLANKYNKLALRDKKTPKIIYLPMEISNSYEFLTTLKTNYQFATKLNPNEYLGMAEYYTKDYITTNALKSKKESLEEKIEEAVEEFNKKFNDCDFITKLDGLDENDNNRPIFKSINGKRVKINELSSGEQQLYARSVTLMMLNPNDSIILIDEPETSLHPSWQKSIMKIYKEIGKNNQFIVTTHSPHIISSIKKEYIKILMKIDNKIKVIDNIEGSYGFEVGKVLTELMGLETLRVPEIEEKIDKLRNLVYEDKYESIEFSDLMKELEEILGLNDRDLISIRLAIAKKRVKNVKYYKN